MRLLGRNFRVLVQEIRILWNSHGTRSFVLEGSQIQVRYSCSDHTKNQDQLMDRPWKKPEGQSQLKLYNSFTKQKEDFIPIKSNRITWYSCGPTVYDASHMGHARSYISFDILRRVLQSYFNYDVFYVMNVTDIDDKIIFKARKGYLLKEYLAKKHKPETVLHDATLCLTGGDELDPAKKFVPLQIRHENENDPDKKTMWNNMLVPSMKSLDELKNVLNAENVSEEDKQNAAENLVTAAKEPLSEWLDSLHGAEITDHKIFAELAKRWEDEFHSDMKALNVLPADCLTRVSQYVPEIVQFIEKIIDNGFAYESGGSVYFDTVKFVSNEKHVYAKLVPEAVGDLSALAEGEGSLSQEGEKRNERDFALWKASKPGEPEWESPWGKGRPGWHIECSVMASDVLGSCMDIHTGGVDLKFPHHDNEIAQSEAHYGCEQWINYFLHTGHLTIEGCKMSKSLKNFITIKDALAKHSSRQIRLAFLLHAWNTTLDYSTNVLREAEQTEKLFQDFFLIVKDILRKPDTTPVNKHNYHDLERDLQENFQGQKAKVHEALCDSIDTPTAMLQMQTLVKQANIYIANKKQRDETANHDLLKNIAKYLTSMLKIFGANEGEQEIGFKMAGVSADSNAEDIAMPYVQKLADFREEIRQIAREEKVTKILQKCDELRDIGLPELGVKLEDQEEGQAAVIKFVDKETLMKERQQKLDEIAKKQRQKEEAKRKAEQEKAAKEAKARIPPWEMFKAETDKYSQFDEQGIPTHDEKGEPLSASRVKKLKKMYQQQEKLYNSIKKT